MFRSLHMKLVLILVLLVISVMAAVGAFLLNSVAVYQVNDFSRQMASVFTTDFLSTLNNNAAQSEAPQRLRDMLSAYSGSLGIDSYREFYILDGKTGDYITGSNETLGRELTKTPNILAAVAGRVGDKTGIIEPYMDIAVPIKSVDNTGKADANTSYIAYIRDSKQELRDLMWMMFAIMIQAILFGLIVAVMLSFLLSKTMTTPLEELTSGALLIAAGDFSHQIEVHSSDEIGVLTNTFNEMAKVLKETLSEVEGERNKLNTLFLHMADGVAAFVRDGGKLLHMNPAAERMLGIKFDSKLTFADVFGEFKLPEDAYAGERGYIESDYSRNGRQLKIFFAPFGLAEGESSGVMAVIHDITEQQKLDDARREFVANVSHELRTPLTNIKSYTETLVESEDNLPPEMKQNFLKVILNEADRMTRIVKDLLTLSRLDYGRLDFEISQFSIRRLLERVVSAMKLDAENHRHTLTLELADDLPEIAGDRERIEQVVVNLTSNAIKYTPDGGKIHIKAELLPGGDRVRISVRDNGIGIPAEDQPRLFERFYRVDKARSREYGGTGLGLAIAKEIVECHRGVISVSSTVGEGTVMTVELPVGAKINQMPGVGKGEKGNKRK